MSKLQQKPLMPTSHAPGSPSTSTQLFCVSADPGPAERVTPQAHNPLTHKDNFQSLGNGELVNKCSSLESCQQKIPLVTLCSCQEVLEEWSLHCTQ